MNEYEVRRKYEKITNILIKENISVTTMESCTSGQIASLITDTEGASAIFKGAFITYSNEAKVRLGVPEEIIDRYGVYSLQTSDAMARACRSFYNADIGIGITGSFGNIDPANEDSTPGEVYYSISVNGICKNHMCTIPPQPTRLAYKMFMADQVADALLSVISGFGLR